MSRPLRIIYPGALYHITVRGNRKDDMFLDNRDRNIFLEKLSRIIRNHNWICHAYCLMCNHFHLLIETLESNLSDGMRDLNKDYAQAFNRLHKTVGHLSQGRFKAFIIEKESYLLEVARYIVLNPVRAKMVDHPKDWLWSSFLATAGLTEIPSFLTTDWILKHFGENRADAQRQYIEFVMAGVDASTPFKNVVHRCILGSPQFVGQMWKLCKTPTTIKEIAREERLIGRPALEDLFQKRQTKQERNQAIVLARVGCGYSVAEISRYLKLSKSLVSKISNVSK